MNIAINDKMYAREVAHNSFEIVEDRVTMMNVGQYTFSHDCLTMLDLYQQLFEVNKCLLKTRVRSTYQMLHTEKVRLTALIESFVSAHN